MTSESSVSSTLGSLLGRVLRCCSSCSIRLCWPQPMLQFSQPGAPSLDLCQPLHRCGFFAAALPTSGLGPSFPQGDETPSETLAEGSAASQLCSSLLLPCVCSFPSCAQHTACSSDTRQYSFTPTVPQGPQSHNTSPPGLPGSPLQSLWKLP